MTRSRSTLLRLPLLRLALLAVLLLAFGLRVALLDAQELRGDEAFGYFFSQRPAGDIIAATIALKEPHPVASYFVQQAWLGVAGDSEFALRFGGVWWGVLAVALLYRLGRRLALGHGSSVLAAALLTLSPYAVWHSQDARMYAMSLALTTAAVLLGLEALERKRWPWAVGYILTAWLALNTHYYAVFVLVALNLYVVLDLLLGSRRRELLLPWLAWQVIVGALYLPWVVRAGFILSGYGGNGDSPGLLDALRRALSVLAVGESTPAEQRLGWTLLAAALLILGAVRLALGTAEQRRSLGLLALYLLVPLAATWVSALSRPIFNERYLVAAVPPFCLLAASVIGWRAPARRYAPALNVAGGLLLAVLVAGMALSLARHYTDPTYGKTRGWRDLAASINALSAGLDPATVRVAQNFPDPTLWYYYRGPVQHLVLPPQANDAAGARAAAEALANQGVQRVILPVQPAANWDSGGLATLALDGWFDRAAQSQEGVWPVQVYARPGALSPVNADFAGGLRLRGAVAAPQELAPGGLLTVFLDWTQVEPAAGDPADVDATKVFVQLLDASGQLVAQDDRPLVLTAQRAAGTGLAAYGIRLPAELGAGPYRLIAGLYRPDQPGAPRILTAEGADHVTLGEFAAAAP